MLRILFFHYLECTKTTETVIDYKREYLQTMRVVDAAIPDVVSYLNQINQKQK